MRFPGGKSRAINQIINFFPPIFSEFREPLVGGGSVFIYIRQEYPEVKVKINDVDKNIYCFWKVAKEENEKLVEEVKEIRRRYKNGKELFIEMSSQLDYNESSDNDKLSNLERARNFFILNRISFSGLATAGGFSKESFKKRFTVSSIERLSLIKDILKDVEIAHGDYSKLLDGAQKGVFIYFDPPYLSTKGSKLYGQNGKYHTNFDHDKFLKAVINCRHNWLITNDYTNETRRKFHNFDKKSLKFQYSMKNVCRYSIPKQKEFIITNYKVEN